MKTLKLFDKYKKLYEQDEATTEVDVDVEAPEPEAEVEPLSSEAEIYLTKLAALAFSFDADLESKNVINSLSQEFGQTDPKKVTDEIQNYLQLSNRSFKAELNEI